MKYPEINLDYLDIKKLNYSIQHEEKKLRDKRLVSVNTSEKKKVWKWYFVC